VNKSSIKKFLSMKWLIIFGLISIIIGGSCLLGGLLPNSLFNQRIQVKTCHQYTSVRSYYCRYGAITQICYGVHLNTQPDGVNCWQAPKIATFTNQQEAESYASRYRSYDFSCYWDWKNPCTYYDGVADVTYMQELHLLALLQYCLVFFSVLLGITDGNTTSINHYPFNSISCE